MPLSGTFKAQVQNREAETLNKLAGFQASLQSSRNSVKSAPEELIAPLDAASAGKKRKLQKEEFAAGMCDTWCRVVGGDNLVVR